jgi:hypothetical protein
MAAKKPVQQSVISSREDVSLKHLYKMVKVRFTIETNKKASCMERDRLDCELDILENCLYASLCTPISKRSDFLRAHAINFNPTEDYLPLNNVSFSQPTPQLAASQ